MSGTDRGCADLLTIKRQSRGRDGGLRFQNAGSICRGRCCRRLESPAAALVSSNWAFGRSSESGRNILINPNDDVQFDRIGKCHEVEYALIDKAA
jgi:hypothetical protein